MCEDLAHKSMTTFHLGGRCRSGAPGGWYDSQTGDTCLPLDHRVRPTDA